MMVFWLARRPRLKAAQTATGAIFFLAASSPLWIYNMTHDGATFIEVFGKFAAADTGSGAMAFVKAFIGNRIWSLHSYVQTWLSSISGGNVILFAGILFGLGLALLRARKLSVVRLDGFSPQLVFVGIAIVAFVAGHRSSRYLYVLPFLLIPPAFAGWKALGGRPALAGLSTVVILLNLIGLGQGLASTSPKTRWLAVIAELKIRQLRHGYSDFWHAYPITFLSDEQIIVAPVIATSNGERSDRYPAYTREVSSAVSTFALVADDSSDALEIRDLAGEGARLSGLHQIHVSNLNLYFPVIKDPLRLWLDKHANGDVTSQRYASDNAHVARKL
jgi:hypothetical protein